MSVFNSAFTVVSLEWLCCYSKSRRRKKLETQRERETLVHPSILAVHQHRNRWRKCGALIQWDFFSATKRNETMSFMGKTVQLEVIIISKLSQSQKISHLSSVTLRCIKTMYVGTLRWLVRWRHLPPSLNVLHSIPGTHMVEEKSNFQVQVLLSPKFTPWHVHTCMFPHNKWKCYFKSLSNQLVIQHQMVIPQRHTCKQYNTEQFFLSFSF